MTFEQLAVCAADSENANIRVDEETQKASVIDVVRLITGQKSGHASQVFDRLCNELVSQCDKLRINGKGRPTPVCDSETMKKIIWNLPGNKAVRFKNEMINRLARGEYSWRELMETGKTSRTENDITVTAQRTSEKPTSDEMSEFFHIDIPEHEQKSSSPGFVYFIRALETNFVKIGVSLDPTRRLNELQTGCPFELSIEQAVFVQNPYQTERALHNDCSDVHKRGEWFIMNPKATKEVVNYVFSKEFQSY